MKRSLADVHRSFGETDCTASHVRTRRCDEILSVHGSIYVGYSELHVRVMIVKVENEEHNTCGRHAEKLFIL
jgi:hypothetical protein